MKTYLISYDLGVPETSDDYKKVIEHIKSYPNWAKPLYSVWFIQTSKTCEQVRNAIHDITDSNDKILVIDVTNNTDWATWGMPKDVSEWMKKSL